MVTAFVIHSLHADAPTASVASGHRAGRLASEVPPIA
jgi:hypothetical protein